MWNAKAFHMLSLFVYRPFTKYTIAENIRQVAAEISYCIIKKSLFMLGIRSGRCFSICFEKWAFLPRKMASPQPIKPQISDPAISKGHSGDRNPRMTPTITCSIDSKFLSDFYSFIIIFYAINWQAKSGLKTK